MQNFSSSFFHLKIEWTESDDTPFSFFCIDALSYAVEEEEEAVGDVHARYATVEIEGDEIQLRVQFLQLLFYAFRYHMVGDTSERLKTCYIVHALFHHADDVARQEPALTELRGKRNHAIHILCILKDIGEGTEIAEP